MISGSSVIYVKEICCVFCMKECHRLKIACTDIMPNKILSGG